MGRVFHHDGDVFVVVKVSVHCEDVLVLEMAVDFDLSSDLADGIIGYYFFFVKEFEGQDHFGLFLFGKVYCSILTVSESSANYEFFHVPFSWVEGFDLHRDFVAG